MTIEEAAQDLAAQVRSTPSSFSVAIGDGCIVVYQHRRGVRLPVNVDSGWHGFAVQFKWMGAVRPASARITYDGSFPLDFLADGESVRAAGDGSGACEVSGIAGTIRIELGQSFTRTDDGRIVAGDTA